MLRLAYLLAMGSVIGAIAGAVFGHMGFWLAVGCCTGVLWRGTAGDNPDDFALFRTPPGADSVWSSLVLMTSRRVSIEVQKPHLHSASPGRRISFRHPVSSKASCRRLA